MNHSAKTVKVAIKTCNVVMSDPSKQSLSNTSPNQNFAMMPSLNSMDRLQGLQDFGLSNLSFQYMTPPNMFTMYQDNNFSLSRTSSFIKEEKDDGSSLHPRPLSAPGSGSSPKPFGAFSPSSDNEKSDKLGAFADLVIGLDKGMSPLSIVTVSNLPDGGHPSPGSSNHQAALRYQPSGDAMLSAINYSESVILQEGSFDVNVSGTLSALEEGLMSNLGVNNTGTNTNSTFDLFDGDTGQDAYMESNQDLQLSPQTFSNNPDAFNENSNLSGINETGPDNTGSNDDGKCTDTSKLTVEKIRTKTRPTKATSPNRQGAQTCFQCGKVFSNSSALAKHKLTHSDERKYVCQLCSKAFKRQDHLNGHMLTHRKKKPYECKVEGCGKSYCDARSLRRHTENHHSNSGSAAVTVSTVTVLPQQVGLGLPPVSLSGSLPYTESKLDVNSFVTTNSAISNRIQYAPPPASPYSATSNSVVLPVATSASVTASTVGGQLQILAFQQTDNSLLSWTQPEQQQQQQLYLGQQVFSDPTPQSPQGGSDNYLPESSTPGVDLPSPIHTPLSQHSDTGGIISTSQSPNVRVSMQQMAANDQSVSLSQDQASLSTNQLISSDLMLPSSQLSQSIALAIPQQAQQQSSQSTQQQHLQQQLQQQQLQQRSWGSQINFNQPPPANFVQEPKPVECPLCHRKFKNVPALNGHMRLHGGYFKKENDGSKKSEKKNEGSGQHPPLQTASMNVRALIEEKIIQRRIVNPQITTQPIGSYQDINNLQQFSIPPLLDINNGRDDQLGLGGTDSTTMDINQDWDLIRQGLLGQQPPPAEKFRRHSDSDHFLTPRRPAANSALVDLLRRKVGKRTQRTGSDPGEPMIIPQTIVNSPGGTLISSPTIQSPLRSPLLQPTTPASIPSSPTTPTAPSAQWSNARTHDYNFGKVASRGAGQCATFSVSSPQACMSSPPTATTAVTATLTVPKPMLDREDDDDVFLNPSSIPTSPMRAKKKHRPEPLFIPPHVNTNMNRFPSQLRSPRLWDPSIDGKSGSPPPYTPPPMLSPVRSGSGLFWHILSSGSLTPKSAPITPRFSSVHKSTSEAAPVEEEEIGEPPETDIHPHVNIGSQYQAVLPLCRGATKDDNVLEDLVWDPVVESNLTEDEMEMYLEFACCAAVPGGGRNKEYALFILHMANGNLQEALLRLMEPVPKLSKGHHLLTYHFPECDAWSSEEIEAYHQSLHKCDKDFFSIAQEIGSKSVKQCVQFYYLWKKVCPDEYKRLRMIRRRREQENIMYNLRSKSISEMEAEMDNQYTPKSDGHPVSPSCMDRDAGGDRFICEYPDCSASFISRQALNGHVRIHGGNTVGKPFTNVAQGRSPGQDGDFLKEFSPVNHNPASNTSATSSEHQEEFPCKVCGKVFSKVKSRSAHMKSHRQGDAEKRTSKYE